MTVPGGTVYGFDFVLDTGSSLIDDRRFPAGEFFEIRRGISETPP
jgi:hypothetical protein